MGCKNTCTDGCLREFDATCIEWTGIPFGIGNISILRFDTLKEILVKFNDLIITKTPFVAISTNSIAATGGGIEGHTPVYEVRLNGGSSNQIEVSSLGLFVSKTMESSGKVKVDADDTNDYLIDQLGPADTGDGILSITPTVVSGKVQFVPTLDVETLLDTIQSSYITQFCEIVNDCIAQ